MPWLVLKSIESTDFFLKVYVNGHIIVFTLFGSHLGAKQGK